MDYTKWTTDELVKLQGLVGAEDASPEEREAIARELKRRQSAPAPAPAAAIADGQTHTAPYSDLAPSDSSADEPEGLSAQLAKLGAQKLIMIGGALACLFAVIGVSSYSSASGSGGGAAAAAHPHGTSAEHFGEDTGDANFNCMMDASDAVKAGVAIMDNVPNMEGFLAMELAHYGYAEDSQEATDCAAGIGEGAAAAE